VPVQAEGDVWTFTAPCPGGRARRHRPCRGEVAALLGLDESDLAADPMWVDTGADQFLIALRSPEAVRRVQPDSGLLDRWPASSLGRKTAYVFAFDERPPARCWRATSSPSKAAVWPKTRAPARLAPTWAAGCWPPAQACRRAMQSTRAPPSTARRACAWPSAAMAQSRSAARHRDRTGTVTIDPVGQTLLA
jgi:hypothetical protein